MTKTVTAIVVEYNPFHNGHAYHIQQARKLTNCDVLVAIMSGNWTQRGEPACLTKWERAKFVLEYGVDLVLELPYFYTCQSATVFASAAMRIAGLIHADHVVFGSETGNLEELKQIASLPFDINRFREILKEGYSYPAAYGFQTVEMGPNDILGIGYLKAIEEQGLPIEAHVIKREYGYHDESLHEFASAKAIRKAIRQGDSIEDATPMAPLLQKYPDWEAYYPLLRIKLLTTPIEELGKILLVNEGIQSLMVRQAATCLTFDEFVRACTSRRYTAARIQRTSLHILTHTYQKDKPSIEDLSYIRVLARNDAGQELLKSLRKEEGLTIANKFVQIPESFRNAELRATRIFAYPYDTDTQTELVSQEIYGQYR